MLKALLAEAPDVSNLPEVNFQKLGIDRATIESLDSAPILVLKRPAWFHEVQRYPRLPPIDDLHHIVLVRDIYETVLSLRKMVFRKTHQIFGVIANRWFVGYWSGVVDRIRRLEQTPRSALIRYEDLVADPLVHTERLFRLIGSAQQTGVDQYHPPTDFRWKWGSDDGGPRIRSLRVLPPVPHRYEDRHLLQAILKSETACRLRRQLGYADLPTASP